VQDHIGGGQPKTQRTDASVATLAHSDRRLGARLTAEELNTGMCSEEGTRTLA
jgi:hypothetical protein